VALAALPSSTPTAAVMPTSVPPSPTVAEILTPPPTETPSLPPTPTPTQTPALPTATATPAFESAGWSFASVQNYPDEYGEGVILYGDVINNTGATQELTAITGTFYDPQGQLVADEGDVFDYWPINIVPAGGRVPFELAVYDVQSVANFNLDVGAQPSSQSLRQDFEFLELNQWSEVDSFCLAGKVKNTGDQLQSHLVILAILYNAQNNVVNFGDFYAPDVENLMGDQTLTFEVCSDPRFQEVANYDLRAWGQ
jgi:hypothetical protein